MPTATGCLDGARELVEATKQSAQALKWASADLREDRNVVAAAVRGNWRALEFVPENLRSDRTVVLAAVVSGGEAALKLAHPRLRFDSELARLASRNGAQAAAPRVADPVVAGGAPQAGADVVLLEADGPAASREPKLSYLWLKNGVLELRAPKHMGTPVADVVRPGDAHGATTPDLGALLRLRFPGIKPNREGHGVTMRVPLAFGCSRSRPTVLAGASPDPPVAAVEERRLDPEDDLFCTLAQVRQKYQSRFSEEHIQEYWDMDCERVELWQRNDVEPACAVWLVKPAGPAFAPVPANALSARAEALAESLSEHGWAIADGFLQACEADDLHALVRSWWQESRMQAGMIGGGIQKPDVRGDLFAIGELRSLPEPLETAQQRVQQLVTRLGKGVERLRASGGVECEPPMLAVYPGGGARYRRHFDGLKGPGSGLMQRRVCTCILYLNPFWHEAQGGCLRLYPDATPDAPTGMPERRVDVEPLHGRLLLFLCEGRNAHEVLPSWRPRFAVTWWVREARASFGAWEAEVSS